MKKIFALTLLAGLLALPGCQTADTTESIPAVTEFELSKYLGVWYENARLPHSFERDMMKVQAVYSLRPDGKVQVLNSGVKNGKDKNITGIAKFKGDSSSGYLRVSFFRPFYGDYKIIYLEPDYSLAIVTSASKDYLWILSRTKVLSQEKMDFCLNKIRDWGFDVSKLEYPNVSN